MVKLQRAAAVALFALLSAHLAHSPQARVEPLSVEEQAVSAWFEKGRLQIEVPLRQAYSSPTLAFVEAELVGPDGSAWKKFSRQLRLRPGIRSTAARLQAPMDASDWSAEVCDQHRLRYRVRTQALDQSPPLAAQQAEGVIALSQACRGNFALSLAMPANAAAGERARILALAEHPDGSKPQPGVQIQAEIEMHADGQKAVRQARAKSGPDGMAGLEFDLPAGLENGPLEVQIEARHGGLLRQATRTLWLNRPSGRILLTTDKPLYQPGQTLHIRLLAISPSETAWPDGRFWVTVRDPERRQVFRDQVTTNRMGVATADWSIPESLRHGQYDITAQSDQLDQSDAGYGYRSVEVRSYELPAFLVEVQPDRPFYLPGQEVNVQVSAQHLSGEDLLSGQVRIVRVQNRRWLYRRQQWELEEETVSEGELDGSGRFDARFDWNSDDLFENLSWHRRYVDQQFTAYLTDPLTGRTEQRRFDLRFSPDPIHIYLTASRPMDGEWQGFVTTFYADGRPAQCSVQVGLPDRSPKAPRRAEVKTNRFGVARLAMHLPVSSQPYSQVWLNAHDGQGYKASWQAEIWLGESNQLRLQTDRTIYQAGQDLSVDIAANPKISTVFLDVYESGRLLVSRTSALDKGWASFRIPYRPDFSGLLSINAYSPAISFDEEEQRYSVLKQVVYPPSGLKVEARTKAVYRPGQKARAEFLVTSQGRPVQSALGVVIADRGVFERLRSDRESRNWGWHETGFGMYASNPLQRLERFGVSYQQLDLSQPIPEDIQLAAGAAFNVDYSSGYRQFVSADPKPDYQEVFEDWFEKQSEGIEKALNRGGEIYLDPSRPKPGLNDLLSVSGLALADLPDPWGNPYQPECGTDFWGAGLVLKSSGPDERPGSRDDFAAIRVHWRYYQRVGHVIRKAALNIQSRTLRPLQDKRALKEEVARLGVDLDALRDPCGAPLRPDMGFEKQLGVVSLTSAGADRQFDTPDDYPATSQSWPHFAPLNQIFSQAVAEHHERTGSLLWDAQSLRRELLLQGIDLDALRDPWGKPYRPQVKIENYLHSLSLHSGGADGRFDAVDETGRSDDFVVWKAVTDYFLEERRNVLAALESYQMSGKAPASAEELAAALSESGVSPAELRDPWNRPYRLVWDKLVRRFDSLCISQYAVYGHPPRQRITPGQTTRQSALAAFRSAGKDGLPGNDDDFDALRLTLVLEQRKTPQGDASEERVRWLGLSSGTAPGQPQGSGAIYGTVADASGGVIPGAEITAIHNTLSLTRTVISGDTGCYSIDRLPPGLYSLRFDLTGFQTLEIMDVPVAEFLQTPLNAKLEIGEISETVTVSAGPEPVHTKDASIGGPSQAAAPEPAATPRLRQYFPETLVWAPLLATDRQGRSVLDFTVADNLTTWELSVLASTADGKIQSSRTSFRSFQPFYAQPDPPPILTVGDEVQLPVAVHNYLDEAQSVHLELEGGGWFKPLATTRQALQVSARNASQAAFPIQVLDALPEARFRVTATGEDASDAVEKSLAVLPYGDEVVRTDNRLLDSAVSFEVTVPKEALAGSVRSQLKVYPDLISHAFDGIEGIIRRPYGCAEQTISSSYPNLIALRALQASAPGSPAAQRARSYLESGYRRLMRYQAPQGGFSYWGGQAEAALEVSAHAWEFLRDVQGWVDVDPKVLESTLSWLLEKQQPDGSWLSDDALTGLLARTLSAGQTPQTARQPLQRAVRYLAEQAASKDDNPYLLATFVSVALQGGIEAQKPMARHAAARLIEIARSQNGSTHWVTRYPTPFRGWGKAGVIETTAAVARALRLFAESRLFKTDPLAPKALSKAKGAALFLLLNKDIYGVWHSTQATFAVLDLLSRFEPSLTAAKSKDGPALTLEATVNGQPTEAEWERGEGQMGPLWLDLSSELEAGLNRIRVEAPPQMPGMLAHLVVHYRRNWPEMRQEIASSPDLSFRVHFDRKSLRLGEEVGCMVEVERHASPDRRGLLHRPGMLLAEVGLPPGVQVNHASLQQEMQRLGWVLGRYEVQPDRLALYLWPRFGEPVKLSFRFRPRLAMRARSAPSQLYDYYNPEARLSLAPALFNVSDGTLVERKGR